MLISFSFENWMSFRDKTTISLVASKQTRHRERLPYIKDYNLRILPILAIYGGNASGKSNIFKAIQFARSLIITGTKINQSIGVEPFRLCSENKNKPSSFSFEILDNNRIYEYSFSATKEKICSEHLVEVGPKSEKVLYSRDREGINIKESDPDGQLEFVKKGTRPNQLFLTNCIEQNNDKFKPIFNVFNLLVPMSPQTQSIMFPGILDEKSGISNQLAQWLKRLDTGIERLGEQEIEDNLTIPNIPDDQKEAALTMLATMTGERLSIETAKNEKNVIKRLIAFHKNADNTEEIFDMSKESDGTKRLLDLLPGFILSSTLAENKSNFSMSLIIDEIDRSLHHMLLQSMVGKYLLSCSPDSRSQIIFTTHDLLLMDQSLLRRDEIYVVERDSQGASSVIPLNEYKGIRVDKDLLKSYLQGRLGGVPRL